MNSNEKTRCTEVDDEKSRMDSEKKARRSSILKPQKPRNPFSTLDFTEPNPDNTLVRASRRVSFASSNFVKPFAADPEKNTIWDNTYEEEVNHTDSTKSSYEQTQEAKSTDILNLTSIYSPTSNNEFFKDVSPPQNIYPKRAISTSIGITFNENKESTKINYKNDNRVANTMDSLISFARSNNKSALKADINKIIYTEDSVKITHSVGIENPISNPFINDISLITPFNDTMDLVNNRTHMTIGMAACIDKENVNPIINDISLVTPIESKLGRSSRLKGKMSNCNVDQEKMKENVVHTKNYPENAQLQNYLGQTTIFNQCEMELTGSLSIMDIKENLIEKANSKTTYFLEEDMELTKALDVKDKTDLHSYGPKYNRMDTIKFNRSEGDMEFTRNLPLSVGNSRPINDVRNENLEEDDMEFTTPFLDKNAIIENPTDPKKATICFTKYESGMDFTTNLSTKNEQINEKDAVRNNSTSFKVKHIQSNDEEDMEFTPPFLDKNAIIENSTDPKGATILYTKCEDDMEFTATLSTKDEQINGNDIKNKTTTSSKIKHIQSIEEEDMEFTTPFLGKNAIIEHSTDPKRATILYTKYEDDMEFTATFSTKDEQINEKNINKTSTSYETKHIQSSEAEDMEFTTPFLSKNAIIEHSTDPKRATILYTKSEDDMEFTTPFLGKNAIIEHSTDPKRATILYTKYEDDMEFTATLSTKDEQINEKNINKTSTSYETKHIQSSEAEDMEFTTSFVGKNAIVEHSTDPKRATILYTKSEDDMEFTTPFLGKNAIIEHTTDPKRATILYTKYEDDMEFTATLSTKDEQINEKNINKTSTSYETKHIQSSEAEDMEFTTPFLGKNAIIEHSTDPKRATILDMEFTTPFLGKNAILEHSTDHKRATILFTKAEDDMQFTTPFLGKNAIIEHSTGPKRATTLYSKSDDDMEITTTLSTKKEQINEKYIIKDTSTSSKMKHVQSIEAKDMEFTTPFLDKIDIDNSTDCKRTTIFHTKTKDDIEFTTYNEQINEKDTIKNTSTSSKVKHIQSIEEDMEFTTPFLDKNAIIESCTDPKRATVLYTKSEDDMEFTATLSAKSEHIKEQDTTQKIYSENQTKIMVKSQSIFDPLPKIEANIMVSTPPIVNGSNSDNKRHSNSENDDDVIKKIKIDNLCLNEPETDKSANENNDGRKTFLGCKQTGKYSENNSLPIIAIESDDKSNTDDLVYKEIEKVLDDALSIEENKIDIKTDTIQIHSNLVPVLTPSVSFHMNLTNMSPCIEDTQQLIHATFSKPESLEMLLLGKKPVSLKAHGNILYDKNVSISSDIGNFEKSLHKTVDESCKRNEKTFTPDQKKDSYDCMGLNKENCLSNTVNPKTERSCYIEDISLDLAPANLDESSLIVNTSNSVTNKDVKLVEHESNEQDESFNNASTCSTDDDHNYTLRCQSVLANIQKYLISYQIKRDHDYSNMTRQIEQLKDQNLVIKDLITNFRLPKIPVIDLEEKHKQDMEDNLKRECESVMDAETYREAPSVAGLVAPKSLHDRICETAKRSKKHWEFVKMEDDYYYFFTLFGTLGFKVHVHPDLGIVYSIETYTNLAAIAKPICWYELKLFQQKLKEENLLSGLGAKFDILTLLDYVCMTMEEIANCHTEYNNLVKEYGRSHHFRMESDFSVIFEIINIDLVICWKISIKMSPTSSVSKDNITATFKVGEKVNEEDIKCIAENTPKGPNFIRNFIENVDEYVRRIAKKIKFRRGAR